jgi:hypothetical protein
VTQGSPLVSPCRFGLPNYAPAPYIARVCRGAAPKVLRVPDRLHEIKGRISDFHKAAELLNTQCRLSWG